MGYIRHGHGGSGASRTREYKAWRNMKNRCDNTNFNQFKDYGGRGIKYPQRWATFPAFLADMGPCPEGHSLERRDNNANYSKGNCQWATAERQANNRRSSVFVAAFGESKTLADWFRDSRSQVTNSSFRIRLAKGWTPEAALFTPRQPTRSRS